MFRSAVLTALIGAAVCLAIGACSKRDRVPAACSDCNVVLISMDTVRADHLGVYGHERATSPNVDRFAQRAAVFENAISQSAWTLPAHGSMMTGLYPGRLGVSHYPAKRGIPKVPMLAEQFRRAGYATGAFTGGGFVAAHFGFSRGFDVYSSDGRRFEHNMDSALAWLQQNRKRRFFLFLHGYDAHRPYFSRTDDKAAVGLTGKRNSERRGFCVKANRTKPADLDVVLQYYDASIRHGDREVGRFLNALEALKLSERTVVLITSDHGEEFFEHGNCDHVRFLYREVVNVPLILRVPGHASEGKRIGDVVPASISVARTLLELVGIDASDFPGASLLPLLRGEASPFDSVYSETDSIPGALGSRGATIARTTARHKLISYLDEKKDEGYDVVTDVGEQQILPEGDPVYEQRSELNAWKESVVPIAPPRKSERKEQPAGEQAAEELPSEIQKQLESLGYLEEE